MALLRPSSRARRRDTSGNRMWLWFMLPGTLWMTGFLIASLVLVAVLAVGTTDELGNPRFGFDLAGVRALADPPTPRSSPAPSATPC